MIQNDMDIIDKLRKYQAETYNLEEYQGDTMNLKNIKFECSRCKVHFSPSEYRAKNLMKEKGVINECKNCENGTSDVY